LTDSCRGRRARLVILGVRRLTHHDDRLFYREAMRIPMRSLFFSLFALVALAASVSAGMQPPIDLPTSIVACDPLEFPPASARLSRRNRVMLDAI
jgi:hypothetical protein